MLEPYDGKLSRTVLRREGGGNTADPADYSPLVNRLKGQVIKISPNSTQFINPMDINTNYSEEDNPLSLKADFILSLCELVVGGKEGLLPVEKTVIDRCVHLIYRKYFANPCPENMPILEDLYNALLQQDEKEAHHVATALEIYVKGSLNLFNHRTNVNVNNRIVCYDIKELGKQMKKLGIFFLKIIDGSFHICQLGKKELLQPDCFARNLCDFVVYCALFRFCTDWLIGQKTHAAFQRIKRIISCRYPFVLFDIIGFLADILRNVKDVADTGDILHIPFPIFYTTGKGGTAL